MHNLLTMPPWLAVPCTPARGFLCRRGITAEPEPYAVLRRDLGGCYQKKAPWFVGWSQATGAPPKKPPTTSLSGLVDGLERLKMGIVPPCVGWVINLQVSIRKGVIRR